MAQRAQGARAGEAHRGRRPTPRRAPARWPCRPPSPNCHGARARGERGRCKNAGRGAAAVARMPSRSAARVDPSPPPSASASRVCAAARQSARQLKFGRGARAHGRAWARAERTGVAGAPRIARRSPCPRRAPSCHCSRPPVFELAWASAERTTRSRASSGGSKDARAGGVAAVPTPVVRGATSGSRSPGLGGLASPSQTTKSCLHSNQ